MLKIISTLKGQVAICILLSLPIQTIIFPWVRVFALFALVAMILELLIPFVVFCMLFGITNGKGAEFKGTRIIIATILWGAFWIGAYFLDIGKLAFWIEHFYGFDMLAALYASYNVIAIVSVVILSYAIGKWVHCKNVKSDDQINEKKE